ncbi:MAG: prepilin-type N-terminal cleavage/methylation domain-containing protein [Kiritimatiellales bacterium]
MTGGKNTNGFTLTEVLVAVAVAALCFCGIYAVSVQCLKQIWSARDASRAALAADYEIENLRTESWSTIEAYGSSYVMSVSNNPALGLLKGGSGTVYLSPLGGSDSVQQATVNISWTGHRGAPVTNFSTAVIVSENGFLR